MTKRGRRRVSRLHCHLPVHILWWMFHESWLNCVTAWVLSLLQSLCNLKETLKIQKQKYITFNTKLKAIDWRAAGGISNIFFTDDINISAKRDVSKGKNVSVCGLEKNEITKPFYTCCPHLIVDVTEVPMMLWWYEIGILADVISESFLKACHHHTHSLLRRTNNFTFVNVSCTLVL